MIEPPVNVPTIIARLEAMEEIGVTQKELDKALVPIWREIDRILAQLGMHREKA